MNTYDANQRDARLLRCLACWRTYWVSKGGWRRYRPYGKLMFVCVSCERDGVPDWAVRASAQYRRHDG